MLLIETPNFTNRVTDLLSENEYYELQDVLAKSPEFGVIIPAYVKFGGRQGGMANVAVRE